MSNPFGDNPPPNPYAAPGPQSYAQPTQIVSPGGPFKEDVPGQPWTMDYFGFVGMVQQNPNWLSNIFLAGLCGLIPIVGPMVLWGYSYENAVVLHRTGGQRHIPFDFGRFGDWLGRGVGPFLVYLVFYVITQVFSFGGQMCAGGVAAAAEGGGGDDAAAAAAGLIAILMMLLLIPLQLFLALLQMPMMMRGGMTGDIGQSFNIGWALDFLKKCWLESFLSLLLLILMGIPAVIIAVITCCIGFLPMIGYFSLINAWFSYQLYRLYLSRMGEPMPLKMPAVPMY